MSIIAILFGKMKPPQARMLGVSSFLRGRITFGDRLLSLLHSSPSTETRGILKSGLKGFSKPTLAIYPLIIIIAIPSLLIINTLWNLRSFNRDANFIIRHQAVSLADTLKPIIGEKILDGEDVKPILMSLVSQNEDLVSAAILSKKEDEFIILYSSSDESLQELSQDSLNKFAQALNQPFAGLSYDAKLAKNVWFVAVPLEIEGKDPQVLSLKLKTDTVSEILSRTSKDSIIILSVLVFITLALLVNHFIFYKKALHTEQLAEIDRLKDEFISMASHELRTPVTALIGYLQLLKDKIPKDSLPVLQEDFQILASLTSDLNTLINDLLDVSRIEQGRLSITLQKIQVNEVISEVITKIKPLAQEKNLSLIFTASDLPIITSDPERLRQILTNLINNSVKYTLIGKIDISASLKDKFIEVTIRDTGIGIPPEEMPKLFDKFHRIKDKQTQEVRGTGLGLWITKQLLEALRGKIYVESIYGTGTSFTFTLPLE